MFGVEKRAKQVFVEEYYTMNTNIQKTLVALAVGAMFTASGAAMAAMAATTTLTWDASGNSPTNPADFPATGGSGTWSTSAVNWSNGTTDAAWNNTADSGYTAVIGNPNATGSSAGYGGTINLGSSITAGGLTFNPTAAGGYYNIAGTGSNTLELTGSSVAVNTNATISANTKFDNGLDVTGSSGLTLSLAGTNTNTVGTKIASGAVNVVSANGTSSVPISNANFGAPLGTGAVTVDSGAVLGFYGGAYSTGTLANNLAVAGGPGTSLGALQFAGSHGVYTDTGTIAISNNAAIYNIGADATVNLNGVISGSGGLTFTGQNGNNHLLASFSLGAAETYSGGTSINSAATGTLVTLNGGANTLPTTTSLGFGPGVFGGDSNITLDLHGNNQQVTGLSVNSLNSGGNVTIEDSTGSGAALTVTGGTLIFNSGGIINLNINVNGSGAPVAATPLMSIQSNSTLDVNATFDTPGTYEIGNVDSGGTMSVDNGGTVNNSYQLLLSFNAPGKTGTLNVNTGGTVNGNIVSLGYGGGTAVVNLSGGTLNADKIYTAGNTPGVLNLNGGTLSSAGTGSTVNNPWIGSNVVLNVQNSGVTLSAPTGTIALAASPFLQGTGSTGGVTVTGGGTVTMSGVNTYTGATTVQSGTLALGGGSSPATISASSLLTVNSGGTFDISAITTTPTTLNGLTISGGTINVAMDGSGHVSNIVLNAAATVSGSNTINFAAASGVTALTPGTYTLLADATGGLAGTFLFGNRNNAENYAIGSNNYLLSLQNSNTAETLQVSAVPEPATLGLFALGGLGLLLASRKRKARV